MAPARAPSPSTPALRQDKLAPKPASLTFEQAAVVPSRGFAALQALRDHGKVQPGPAGADRRRIGRRRQPSPCSSPRPSAPRSPACAARRRWTWSSALGADHVIDYTRRGLRRRRAERYDLILDIGGDSPLSRLRRALAPQGERSSSSAAKAVDRWIGIDRQIRALMLSPFVGQKLGTFVVKGERPGPADPERAHRVREGHTGHRPDLPTERRPRRHPLSRDRRRTRTNRNHRLSRGSSPQPRTKLPPRPPAVPLGEPQEHAELRVLAAPLKEGAEFVSRQFVRSVDPERVVHVGAGHARHPFPDIVEALGRRR